MDGDEPVPPDPYVFEPDDLDPATAVLDVVFADLVDGWGCWSLVEQAVAELDPAPPTPLINALRDTCVHGLTVSTLGQLPDCTFGSDSQFSWAGVVPIADSDPELIALWRAVRPVLTAPAARARINDLLFTVRDGKVGTHARDAINAYLEAIDGRVDDLSTTACLMRARSLARLTRNTTAEEAVLAELHRRTSELLAGDGMSHPGVLYPLISALCEPTQASVPADAPTPSQYLDQMAAVEVRGHLAAELATLRRRQAAAEHGNGTPELAARIREIDLDQVEAHHRNSARATHPASRMHHLKEAIQLADSRGLTARAAELTAEMQTISPDDLAMEVIRTESALPAWVPESYLARFTRSPDWRAALGYFFTSEVPSGDVTDLRSSARPLWSMLSRLFPTALHGADGLPVVTLNSDEAKAKHDLAQVTQMRAEFHGRNLAIALVRMQTRYGRPSTDDITGLLLDLGAADTRLARSLARGLHHFWNEDYEASVHVVLPKIEAAARGLLRSLDEGIYRVQAGKDPGGYVGLYSLLENLERLALDESWAWFLRWLLLGPIGVNLRNEVAHGFVCDISPTYAALVLRAAAVLIVAAPQATDVGRSVAVRPTTPTSAAAIRALDHVFTQALDIAITVERHTRRALASVCRALD
ncbi:DUF4209 domain-containing protein [Nocardioides sp. CFH 31398]|uniref:DUF4209 domain-containing protein n=1 Tax=Nocardioides sp. CFH 31398 TaxID=2919579 RepID=UPI001F06412D|nr:DUF4209 domain-containing protein [Nocardioides sp. CFH 31398]MCH1868783.1 DUF4209 domain-containing protein [Nocardioides sp. CFH 31398]